jgi:hypothetical protein
MNFLKKGPELKLSEVKVPGFLGDIYYDLKERHLLPIVALLIVAIVAVPIMVSKSDSEVESPTEAVASGVAESASSPTAGALVAKASPGLRDYRRRLDHRTADDPFAPMNASSDPTEGGGSSEGGGGSGSAGEEPEAPTDPGFTGGEAPAPEPSPATPTPPPLPDEEPGTPGDLTYYSYAIDVRVTGGGEEKKATVRRNLPELTMLPSRETPAIVYMGATKDGKKAVMTVSPDVESIFGDAKCMLGSDRCQLLVMEPGLPVTFVYGAAQRTYKVELVKVHLVETDKLNRAPLGKPKKSGKGDEEGGSQGLIRHAAAQPR